MKQLLANESVGTHIHRYACMFVVSVTVLKVMPYFWFLIFTDEKLHYNYIQQSLL